MAHNYPDIAAQLLARAPDLLAQWLPNGKRSGSEWTVGSLAGEAGHSLSINMRTGVWKDFAGGEGGGEGGGDLLSLYAAIHNLRQGEAADALGFTNGRDHGPAMVAAPIPPTTAVPEPALVPAPPDAPPLPKSRHGEPTAVWTYRDAAGAVLCHIARFDPVDGRKQFTPYRWSGDGWEPKGLHKPRPLYGLDRLAARPDLPVMVTEGEKACEAAIQLWTGCVCTTWMGGVEGVKHTDWTPLAGRTVHLWPDADTNGKRAMLDAAEILLQLDCRVIMHDQDDMPDGWDLADALAEGWDPARAIEHTRREDGSHKHVIMAPAPKARKEPAVEKEAPAIEAEPEPPKHVKPRGAVEHDGNKRSAVAIRNELGLSATEGGVPHPTESNAMTVLTKHPDWAGRIYLDVFGQRLMMDDKRMDKTEMIGIQIWMQQNIGLHKLPLAAVERACIYVGFMNQRHELREYLDALAWDGVERLPGVMARAWGTKDDDYTRAVGRCWFVSLMARVYDPGCQADYMPVFEGGQGVYKTTSLRILGGKWFLDAQENPLTNRKDFLGQLQGKWIIEIPEMNSLAKEGRSAISRMKAIITCRTDNYRKPYGATDMEYPRQCVFAGTTNEQQWAADPTGNRRFWPIRCGRIDTQYLTEMRDQLFAEAIARYKRGEKWHDVPIDLARQEQEERRDYDEWEEIVRRFIHKSPARDEFGGITRWYDRSPPLDSVTVSDILEIALNKPAKEWRRDDKLRVTDALRNMGWVTYRRIDDGSLIRAWRPGAHPENVKRQEGPAPTVDDASAF